MLLNKIVVKYFYKEYVIHFLRFYLRVKTVAEDNFTYYFKHNLAENLETYFDQESINLEVKTEYRTYVGHEENRIDIAICNSNADNYLVGIEIEMKSNRKQIFYNYEKFKKWVHASQNRKGGLMHIVFEDTYFSMKDIYDLFLYSYDDTSKGLDFYYEFFKLENIDKRKHNLIPDYLVNEDWEFNARLFSLMAQVFGKRYMNSF